MLLPIKEEKKIDFPGKDLGKIPRRRFRVAYSHSTTERRHVERNKVGNPFGIFFFLLAPYARHVARRRASRGERFIKSI